MIKNDMFIFDFIRSNINKWYCYCNKQKKYYHLFLPMQIH